MDTAATDKMLEKVRALIAKAEGTDNAHEAETYLEKAQALMLKHSIDEAMLNMARPAEDRIRPESLEWFKIADAGTPIRDQIINLAAEVAEHFGCKIVFFGLRRGGARDRAFCTVIGFPSDLRSFQTLFTALHLDLVSRLQPRPDVSKSFDENVYNLHEAGVNWRQISNIMNRAYQTLDRPAHWRQAVRVNEKFGADTLVPWDGNSMDGGRLIRAYKRHCAAIGEAPRVVKSPVMYQRNFAAGYVGRVTIRLIEARTKNDSAEVGSALALRSNGIEELFKEMFPKVGKAVRQKDIGYDPRARTAGREAGDRADLGGTRFGDSKRPELS